MDDPAPFPLALAALLAPPPVSPRSPASHMGGAGALERCLAYLARLPEAIAGSGGHNATFRAACEVWRFGLDEGQAWEALQWWNAAKCQPAWGEGELRHKLESARERVAEEGRTGVRLDERVYGYAVDPGEIYIPEPELTAEGKKNGHKPTEDAPATKDETGKPPVVTDTELRDRYVSLHPTTVFGLGDWYRYENGIYNKLPEPIVQQEVQRIIDEEVARDRRMRPSLWQTKSVLGLIRNVLTVPDNRWNANADILVCRNKTLIISERRLRPHSPYDYVTSGVNYDYDPQAKAETWERYLDRVLPHAREFLQEFAGLSLTTITDYEIAVWLYGPPGGGKSTFIDGIKAMLSDRHGVLGLSDIERSQFMLYSLIGRTLVTATENPDNFPIALGKVNQIISGEPITVDLKHKTPIEITPAAKVLWSMNDLPRVTDANNGIFRRVKVVRVKPIPKNEIDPEVKKAIKCEGAGILNWALDGLERLKARGNFIIPEDVESETNEFKASNDAEQAFVNEECDTYPSAQTKSSVLYDAYKEWCKANGHGPKSSTRVSKEWERLGFKKAHNEHGNYWQGVAYRQPKVFDGKT